MLEQAIVTIVLADDTIKGMVKDRLRPVLASQQDAAPYITYDIPGRDVGAASGLKTFKGKSAWSKTSVEFGCYGRTYAEASRLSKALSDVLDGEGFTTDTTKISPSILEDESEVEQVIAEGQGKPVRFVRFQTYSMLHREL